MTFCVIGVFLFAADAYVCFFEYICSMKKYGLIGKKLGHSWSKKWFEDMFLREGISDAGYQLYEMPSLEHLLQWVSQEGIYGFNVTIPYKEEIIPLLDHLDAEAEGVGAVNCVAVDGGRLIGHNTDAPAFAQTLQPLLHPWHTRALILGTGGGAKAVAFALKQLGIDYTFVSRTSQKHPNAISYAEASVQAASTFLIINCTPAGMFPNNDTSPWPTTPPTLSHRHLCYDLVYNPPQTHFLQQAQQSGAATANGLAMLQQQAQLSWQIWLGSLNP